LLLISYRRVTFGHIIAVLRLSWHSRLSSKLTVIFTGSVGLVEHYSDGLEVFESQCVVYRLVEAVPQMICDMAQSKLDIRYVEAVGGMIGQIFMVWLQSELTPQS